MKNFGRALRITLRYRWTFLASVFCALVVAVLWGGNITAIYPVVEVAFRGQSLQQWVDGEIESAEQETAEQKHRISELQAAASDDSSVPLDTRGISRAELQIEYEQSALVRFRRIKPYVDRYLPNDPFQTLVYIIVLLVCGTILKSMFFIVQSILVTRLAQLTTVNLRREFYRRTLRMDVATFGSQGSSDLMSRFTHDMEHVAVGIHALCGKMVREPLKGLACLVGAAFICWRLLFFSLVIAPLAIFLVGRLARILKRANRRAMEEMAQIYGILEETFQGIKVVKAFTMERQERHRFHNYSKNYYKKAMRIGRYDALSRPLTEIMGIAMISLAIVAGAYLVLEQETHLFGVRMCDRPLSTGALFTFYGLLAGVSDPARKLSQVFSRIQRSAAAADRIYVMLDREPAVRDPARAVPLVWHSRSLSFEGVHFSYVPGTPVLNDINLKIEFGETIAIVGSNGCGKSTLANLVPRFYDPNQGRLLLDGTDVRDMRVRDLRRQIGAVAQETLLFDDTVMANILYGSPESDETQAITAAKKAHAHRFIEEQLEDGYKTVVGPRGNLLSGGQRQRIALARAILRNPRILILDEATSQIDLESEQLIHRVLVEFIRHNTTIIITHRMSTLDLADRIVVMEQGRITDVGTRDELLRRCQLFAKLYRIQFKETA